ncbi:hypothetical protein HMPREF9318_01194 [Streptococcus urinalis FB127-CNA-2]|uniref:Bacterial ABC transporter protein EcsB domain protein n=1 Tax=Streptococcus urinalis 2285-97 TaxID=764291 RepID=G5KI68_9STRE|nr:ABC transporter permease [Streptococcus urinalis]EHJ56512.1 bacterial ABC transporter protein EcsB domain protein [Streptococcus urinalis 2285-97]EKS20556.1 hypothetical protein HMPREF9318_01194 [Streptococcus urinalis FB127-CNA-2]VEF31249.1 ABC transporter, permease protein EscB [Streptococcus urinalis]
MRTIFSKRRDQFQTQLLKYSRYVLNDHFVLVLLFLMGFILVQYSQLLRHFPKNHWPIIIIILMIIVFLLSLGKIATYVENPDKLFLLTKEKEILKEVNQATKRAYIWQFILQTTVMVLFLPIFLKLGLNIYVFVILLCFMAIIKYLLIQKEQAILIANHTLKWSKAIEYEANRKQIILKFFSLFTTVKGVTTSVKRRAYLDWVLKYIKKSKSSMWKNLYIRAFLRSSDYFGLTIRLLILSLLSILVINNHIIAGVLVIIFNYLLLFQLLPLFNHFDYSLMNKLMPVSKQLKVANLKQFLNRLFGIIVIVESLFSLNFLTIFIIVIGYIMTMFVYLPYKLKKMID